MAIEKNGPGSYLISAKLANTLLSTFLGVAVMTAASIITFWFKAASLHENMNLRIGALEREISSGILPSADVRVTVIEARLSSIQIDLRRISDRLDRLNHYAEMESKK